MTSAYWYYTNASSSLHHADNYTTSTTLRTACGYTENQRPRSSILPSPNWTVLGSGRLARTSILDDRQFQRVAQTEKTYIVPPARAARGWRCGRVLVVRARAAASLVEFGHGCLIGTRSREREVVRVREDVVLRAVLEVVEVPVERRRVRALKHLQPVSHLLGPGC
jgi:hypothetical protein